MKLSKFSDERLIAFSLKSTKKDEVMRELVDLLSSSPMVKDADQLFTDIQARESLVTTGIGHGVAFPHAKTKSVKGIVIAFARSNAGVDFDAMDHKPVHLFFIIAAPEDAIGAHLHVMSQLSFLMKQDAVREKLMTATSQGEVLALMDNLD